MITPGFAFFASLLKAERLPRFSNSRSVPFIPVQK